MFPAGTAIQNRKSTELSCSRPETAIQNRKVKLICSWPGTAFQNRKTKLICSWPGMAVQKKKETWDFWREAVVFFLNLDFNEAERFWWNSASLSSLFPAKNNLFIGFYKEIVNQIKRKREINLKVLHLIKLTCSFRRYTWMLQSPG